MYVQDPYTTNAVFLYRFRTISIRFVHQDRTQLGTTIGFASRLTFDRNYDGVMYGCTWIVHNLTRTVPARIVLTCSQLLTRNFEGGYVRLYMDRT